MLTNPKYIELIKSVIENTKNETNITDICLLWEHTKCQISTETVRYSIKRAKLQKETIKKLASKIELMEKHLEPLTETQNLQYNEYLQTKGEWEKLIKNKQNGIILRSKAKWAEEGEKNTKYFLNLEKRNYNRKCIKKLIGADGNEITNPKEIIEEQRKFDEDLYSSKLKNKDQNLSEEYFLDNKIPKLDEELKNLCELELTIEGE